MSVFHNAHAARDAVQYLLQPDIIPASVFHNTVALLAQETSTPTSNFGDAVGHWTMAVVKRVLAARGYQCTLAQTRQTWHLDSLKYLCRNPGLVGFLQEKGMVAFVGNVGEWQQPNGTVVHALPTGTVWAIHRKWTPLDTFYQQGLPFTVCTREEPWKKHEAEPTSCWHTIPISYKGREKAIARQLGKWDTTPILMSNNSEMVLCQPTKKGWKTHPLLNYECLSKEHISQRVAERLVDSFATSTEQGKVTHGWDSLAHAMFGLMQHYQLYVDPNSFSDLTPVELQELKSYEKKLTKATQKRR
jgi:hypothetical protein